MIKNCLKQVVAISLTLISLSSFADSIPQSAKTQWRIGVEVGGGYVPQSSAYLKGENELGKRIEANLAGTLRLDFSDDRLNRDGYTYKGVYQGLGIGVNSFFSNRLLGTPVLVDVFQGAPIVSISDRLSFGYEWKFGAAMGWKHPGDDSGLTNRVVSTSVTAHLGVGLKFIYRVDDKLGISFGLEANHFSNGNTSLPNNGVNNILASVGATWTINPVAVPNERKPEAEKIFHAKWFYDIIGYGAWRRKVVHVGDIPEGQLCPGKFGVAGLQFSPMRWLDKWVAVGPSLDLQWDESAALDRYWVEGTEGNTIRFQRPPFSKQISVGLSAHAELTAPIFAVNIGLGLNVLCPHSTKRFYQSLTLKTFVTDRIFLNVGYRLGSFSDPENLMLGLGFRL
ncbi:MAG: acyloxyacyl hydrolase [Paramuribaculum sp.]|nr:acyloxyacyl hydrolase [Paramuribaculum sp.]